MTAVCPFCRTPIEGEEVSVCPDCDTPHHLECWMDNNGCSIAGCTQAPEDDPKMTVTQSESHSTRMGPRPGPDPGLQPPPPSPLAPAVRGSAKKRTTFMLLGLCLGALGFHNIYAGHLVRGAAQLAITCLTLYYGAVITWPWAIVEVLVVSRDGRRQLLT